MLHDLQPKGAIAVLLNPDLATTTSQTNDIQVAARTLNRRSRLPHGRN
jgi:hypothetical protein